MCRSVWCNECRTLPRSDRPVAANVARPHPILLSNRVRCSATASMHIGLAQVLRQFDANSDAASVRVHALRSAEHEPAEFEKWEPTMKSIQVYDKPMCCSTGVCGPQVDPVLPRFAADLDWVKSQGHQVERFNLAQQPQAFIQNPEVQQLLATQGTHCLPLIMVDGHIVSQRGYPTREILNLWTQSSARIESPPVAEQTPQCSGSKKCC